MLTIIAFLGVLTCGVGAQTLPSGQIVPKTGWTQGRRISFYEFSGAEKVTTGDAPARLYSLMSEDAGGALTPLVGHSDIGNTAMLPAGTTRSPDTPKYTGIWEVVHVAIPSADTAKVPVGLSDEAGLLSAVASNVWALVPNGTFLHCPMVEPSATLQLEATVVRTFLHNGVQRHCLQLQADVRAYPGRSHATPAALNGTIPLWELRRLPTKQHVVGNTLLEVPPDDIMFLPYFTKVRVHVAPDYVLNSVTSYEGLLATVHKVADEQDGEVVTWYVSSIDKPFWETETFPFERQLDNGTRIQWKFDGGSKVRILMTSEFGVGWMGLGFSSAATEDLIDAAGAETVVFYRGMESRSVCVRFGYTPSAATPVLQRDPTLSPDNMMSVSNAQFQVLRSGTMVAMFDRLIDSQTFDSTGKARPASSITPGSSSVLTWSTQRGPQIESCEVSAPLLFNGLYQTEWRAISLYWADTGIPPPTPVPPLPPPPLTPSPVLSAVTPVPEAVNFTKVSGVKVFNTKLAVAWRMTDPITMEYSIRYGGNLTEERTWVGIGVSGEFNFADIITVWVDKGGSVRVEDRKNARISRPPLDQHQDVSLVHYSVSGAGVTTVNFSRALATGDLRRSVQLLTLRRAELRPAYLTAATNGFQDGIRFAYIPLDTPGGGPFGDTGLPASTPVFILVSPTEVPKVTRDTVLNYIHTAANGTRISAIPGQFALLSAVPGQAGYSDVKQIFLAVVPDSYTGGVVKWAHAIPEAWQRVRLDIWLNCPTVRSGPTLPQAYTGKFWEAVLWYDDATSHCLGFAPASIPSFVQSPQQEWEVSPPPTTAPALPILWEQTHPEAGLAVGVLANGTDLLSASGIFLMRRWNSTLLDPTGGGLDVGRVVNDTSGLPPSLTDPSGWVVDNQNVLYVNRFPVEVFDSTGEATPAPADLRNGYSRVIQLYPPESFPPTSTPKGTVLLRWTLNEGTNTIDIQMEATFIAGYEPGYVGVGFSNSSYLQMENADMVVGMRDNRNIPCVKSLYSVHRFGVPQGEPTMGITNEKVEVDGRTIQLSFRRGLPGGAHEAGVIPQDPLTPSRVLFATSDSVSGSCSSDNLAFLEHDTFPHGSQLVYWKLSNGTDAQTASPSTTLPDELDKEVSYTKQVSFFLNSQIEHYVVNNAIQRDSAGDLVTMYVYEMPTRRRAIVDSVPGYSSYSDLMKVRRVRLPQQNTDDITSLAALRAVDAYIEETDYYWNCPIVSLKANFVDNTSDAVQMKFLWYQDQVVQCAHFGNVTHNKLGRIYTIYEEGESVSQPPPVVKTILPDIPSGAHYSPFKSVFAATVPVGERGKIRSATDLLAIAQKVEERAPQETLNLRVTSIDPGTPITLKPVNIPPQPGWFSRIAVHYIDLSDPTYYIDPTTSTNNGVLGRVPILDGKSIVTAEVLAFRSIPSGELPEVTTAAAYWRAEVQPNVAPVVPGQTGYSHVWQVTVVGVPSGFAGAPISRAEDVPTSWPRFATEVMVTCAVVHPDTNVTALPDGIPLDIPRRSWLWGGTSIECLLFSESQIPSVPGGDTPFDTLTPGWDAAVQQGPSEAYLRSVVAGRVYTLKDDPTRNYPVFDVEPWVSATGLAMPYSYSPSVLPAQGRQVYRSAAEVLTTPVEANAWAMNMPIVAVANESSAEGAAAVAPPRYDLSRPKLAYYRNKLLNFWPVWNTTGKRPLTFPLASTPRASDSPSENPATHQAPLGKAYLFYQGGRLLSSLLPVFESLPKEERYVAGGVEGHSDLVAIQEVLVPDNVDPVPQLQSVAEIAQKQWPVREQDGGYHYWPVCAVDSAVPSGVEIASGFHNKSVVHFMKLNRQSTRSILRAYRVKSGAIVMPYLPESEKYSVFHTLWAAPGAPDSFDPTTDLGIHATYPLGSAEARPYPILAAPSASIQQNEVDTEKVYEKNTAYVEGLPDVRVFYYRFANTPIPFDAAGVVGNRVVREMPAYALRFNGTVFTAAEAQPFDIVPRSAGQPGYSDFQKVYVVDVPLSGVYGASNLPITSTTALHAESLEKSWAVTDVHLLRIAPAVHPDSVLAERAHRYLFPKDKMHHASREGAVISFGHFGDDTARQLVSDPTTVYKVVNSNNQANYIMSRGIGGACLEVVKLAGHTSRHPIRELDARMQECSQKLSEVSCPREHCVWNGTCVQPITHYSCPTVGSTGRSAPLVALSRQTGYYGGRELTYYSSPNSIPGNSTHALSDRVFVFRHPPAVTSRVASAAAEADEALALFRGGESVPGLPPVFEHLPGEDARGGGGDPFFATTASVGRSFGLSAPLRDNTTAAYSDVHNLIVVEVPRKWIGDGTASVLKAFGQITTLEDAVFVASREGWAVRDTGRLVNYWVVDPDSSVEPRDMQVVPKATGWAEGVGVGYFDLGFVSSMDLNERYIPVRSGVAVPGNAIFLAAQPLTESIAVGYRTLSWDVAVRVPADYSVGNITHSAQLAGLTGDFDLFRRISNNPIMSLDAPISVHASDDLDINPLAADQLLLWGYGTVDTQTQEIQQCVDKGTVSVAYLASASPSGENTPVPFAPGGQPPVMSHCYEFVANEFTLCWTVLGPEIWIKYVLKAGTKAAIGVSGEEGMRNTDIWKVVPDPSRDPSEAMLRDCWNGAVGHSSDPLEDSAQGGSPGLTYIQYSTNDVRDRFNVTFRRPLLVGDITDISFVNITNQSYYIYYAHGLYDIEKHTSQGVVCIQLLDGTVDEECVRDKLSYWWVDFTVLYLVTMAFAAYYTTRYSPKNFFWRVSVLFQGSEELHMSTLQAFLVLSYLVLLSMWIGLYAEQYKRLRHEGPEIRAFGAGAMLPFSLFLLPLASSSPLLWLFGITRRRARRWHRFNCRALFLLVAVHGLGMIGYYASDALTWKDGESTRSPGAAGLASFAGLLVMLFINSTSYGARRRYFKPRTYDRIEFVAGIWAFVWAHVHHSDLLYGSLFSLLLVVFDWLYWAYLWGIAHGGITCSTVPVTCFQEGSRRSAVASYQEETYADGIMVCCVEVKIAVSNYSVCYDLFGIDRLQPMQYVLVSFPSVDAAWNWHPVAMSNRPVHIADDQMEPLRGEPTTTFTFHILCDTKLRRSWATSVHTLVAAKQLGRIRVMGPFGRPSVDFRRYEHVILVGGGMGAAPLMSLLEYYLDPRWGQQVPVGVSRTKIITLVWAAKDRRMFDLFCGQQPTGTVRMALDVDNEKPTSNLNFVFRAYLHETGQAVNPLNDVEMQEDATREPGKYAVDQMQEIADAKARALGCQRVQILFKGRPNLFQGSTPNDYTNIFETLSVQNELGNPEVPGLSDSIRAAAVAVCGPPAMQSAVRKSVDKLNLLRRRLKFHIHNETWE